MDWLSQGSAQTQISLYSPTAGGALLKHSQLVEHEDHLPERRQVEFEWLGDYRSSRGQDAATELPGGLVRLPE